MSQVQGLLAWSLNLDMLLLLPDWIWYQLLPVLLGCLLLNTHPNHPWVHYLSLGVLHFYYGLWAVPDVSCDVHWTLLLIQQGCLLCWGQPCPSPPPWQWHHCWHPRSCGATRHSFEVMQLKKLLKQPLLLHGSEASLTVSKAFNDLDEWSISFKFVSDLYLLHFWTSNQS